MPKDHHTRSSLARWMEKHKKNSNLDLVHIRQKRGFSPSRLCLYEYVNIAVKVVSRTPFGKLYRVVENCEEDI